LYRLWGGEKQSDIMASEKLKVGNRVRLSKEGRKFVGNSEKQNEEMQKYNINRQIKPKSYEATEANTLGLFH